MRRSRQQRDLRTRAPGQCVAYATRESEEERVRRVLTRTHAYQPLREEHGFGAERRVGVAFENPILDRLTCDGDDRAGVGYRAAWDAVPGGMASAPQIVWHCVR